MPGFPVGTSIKSLGRPFIGSTGDFSFFTQLQGPDISGLNDDVLPLEWSRVDFRGR